MNKTMNKSDMALWAALGIVVLAVGRFLAGMARDITRIDLNTKTSWDFNRRRGTEEARSKGLLNVATEEIPPHVREVYAPLLSELKTWYRDIGIKLGEREQDWGVERHFGERLVRDICPPLNIYMGACLVLASRLMREP